MRDFIEVCDLCHGTRFDPYKPGWGMCDSCGNVQRVPRKVSEYEVELAAEMAGVAALVGSADFGREL